MPTLRKDKRRRNRKGAYRRAAPKRRKRRNLVKFIPEADSDFALTARNFAWSVQNQPEKYHVPADEAAALTRVVEEYRSALQAHTMALYGGRRSQELKRRKDAARERAEEIVRRYSRIIRADPEVSDSDKRLLRIKVPPKKLGKRKCPKHPPRLRFLGSGDGVAGGGMGAGSGSGVHVVEYSDGNDGITITASGDHGKVRRARPDGAARIELFFDMVPVGEPIPRHPAERGWPKYVRSFTRSPMEVEFPIPSEPMLIVYWARWADSTGEVSRWSNTCVARVEGWSQAAARRTALPAADGGGAAEVAHAQLSHAETKCVVIQMPIAGELTDDRRPPDEAEYDSMFARLRDRLLLEVAEAAAASSSSASSSPQRLLERD